MDIKKAVFVTSSPDFTKCPAPNRPEIAFIGRSNVGKSSLINMLTMNSKLAKVSATPGKTQLINHFLINEDWYLVDLPGYGYAKVSQKMRKEWEQMIANYLTQRENLKHIFVLIDGRHEPQRIDLEFIDALDEWQVPFTLIFTKADKTTQREVAFNMKLFKEALLKQRQFLPYMIASSSVKHHGKKEILRHIDELVHGEMKA